MLKVVGNESAQDEVDGRSLLDEIAREGARRMIVTLEAEVAAYLEAHRDERDEDGRAPGRPQRQGPTGRPTQSNPNTIQEVRRILHLHGEALDEAVACTPEPRHSPRTSSTRAD